MQLDIAPYSGRAEWKRILLLVVVLASIVLTTTGLTISLLYSAALKEQGGRLLEIAQSEARTIEALARFEAFYVESTDVTGSHYMDVLVDAHAQYEGFGETGEFTLAKLENDQIVFLLSHRHYDLDYPEPVPFHSELAEPMRRALQGETGTVIGLDYRGAVVLAAFEPVSEVDLGIVAKIDLAEIRAPYTRAVLIALGPMLAAILLGAFLFTRITRPIVRRIEESQQRYQELIETMHDGLAVQNEAGIIQYANRQYCRILDRDKHEIVGTTTDAFMTEESKRHFAQQMQHRRQGKAASYELSFLRPDGTTVTTLVSPQPMIDAAGEFCGSFATISDITHLKDTEQRLREEREVAQRYLDIAGVMFIVLDRDGKIILINKRGLEILGYTHSDELVGRQWFDTCIPPAMSEDVKAVFGRILAGESSRVEYFENSVVRRDGSTRIIAWHNTVLTDSEGRVSGTLSSGDDVTEQRQVEQQRLELESQLRQGQKLEAIGTLASGVAHEINNPLTGIINYAQLIGDRTDQPPLREFAQGIVDEGNRVATIVKSLLSFSRQESERHSPASMSDILDSTLSLIGSVLRKDQIRIDISVEPDLPMFKCRTQQIQQVLINLFTNARDALNDRYPEHDENKILRITVGLIHKEGRAWIQTVIEDQGSGIPADVVDRIFDPFFSTKPREKGTGLGLSISYGLVRDHHGHLSVESLPNVSTRFIMDLPVENGWSIE